MMMVVVLMVASLQALAQGGCDLTLRPEGNNLCVLERTAKAMEEKRCIGFDGKDAREARHADRDDEARMQEREQGTPPPLRDIEGPDTVCPGFAAEYSATPSSEEYYIEWEWVRDGDTHTYAGDKVTILFGNTVEGIRAYQVSRRTGCRSEAAEKAVGAFRLAEWPYNDIVRLCPGQREELTRLRDQSGDNVLYEWKVERADVLSIQGDHMRADVELLANYTEGLPAATRLTVERQFCGNKQYDMAIVQIGDLEAPEMRPGAVSARGTMTLRMENDCKGNLVIGGEGWDGEQTPLTAQVERQSGTMEPLTATGHNRVSVQMPDTGWFRVNVTYGKEAEYHVDTLVHFDPLPTIERMDVRDMMCEQTAFAHRAEATGEGLTYRWSFGDGSWNYGKELDHVYGYRGMYEVTLTVTDRNGCTCTRSKVASVSGNDMDNIQMMQLSFPDCPGHGVIITVMNNSLVCDTNINSFAWAPCSQFGGNHAMVDRTGTYMVEMTSNDRLCRKKREHNVAYPNSPTALIECDSSYSLHDEARLTGNVGAGYEYRWTIRSASTEVTASTGNVDLHLEDSGYYHVTLTVTDTDGCSATSTRRFYVRDTPVAPHLGLSSDGEK